MNDEPPMDELAEGTVHSRHYKVPIAHDERTNRALIPAEAEKGSGRRYQCYNCRRFLRVITRKDFKDRPRAEWFFAHAPHEGSECHGESFDHLMAVAFGTWLVTRHVEGDTSLSCNHRCARCQEIIAFPVPRDGLRASIGHAYQGTTWRCDVALLDPADRPSWGLEVRKEHAVDREKAVGIPCAWAEMVAQDLLDLAKDPARRYQSQIALTPIHGRPSEPPMRPNGTWHCASCAVKPPPPELPTEPGGITGGVHHKDHEEFRRKAIVRLATDLEATTHGRTVEIILPELCPQHHEPLRMSFHHQMRAMTVATPPQNPQALTWDITLTTVREDGGKTHITPLGILVVGERAHPLSINGTATTLESRPFLTISMASIKSSRPRALMAVRIDLPRWCPTCRADEEAVRLADLQQEREYNAHQERIAAYIAACRALLTERTAIEVASAPLSRLPAWVELLSQRIYAYRHGVYSRLVASSHALTQDDVDWFENHWDQALDDDTGLPDETFMPGQRDEDAILAQYSPDELSRSIHAGISARIKQVEDQKKRIANYTDAAYGINNAKSALDPYVHPSGIPHSPPTQDAIDAYKAAYVILMNAVEALTAADITLLRRDAISLYDPVTNQIGTSPGILTTEGRVRLRDLYEPDRVIPAVTTKVREKRELAETQQRWSQAWDLLRRAQGHTRTTLYSNHFGTVAALEERFVALCEVIQADIAATLRYLDAMPIEDRSAPAYAAIQGELEKLRPFGTVDGWREFKRALVNAVKEQEREQRSQNLLQETVRRGIATTAIAPPPPVDYAPQITAAAVTLRALCDHLQAIEPHSEWDVVGATLPAAARASIAPIPTHVRPEWMRVVADALQAGMLIMTSAEKRDKIIGQRLAIPETT